jgi:hypothetical protein
MNHGRMHKGALAAAVSTPGALGLHLCLLDALDGDLLLRLLAPHREFLERAGIVLRLAGDVDGAWRRHLRRVFATTALPTALADALRAVGDLSTDEGAHRLRDVANERGLPPLGTGGRTGNVNHAVIAYLDRHPLFDAAQQRIIEGLTVDYFEWRASGPLRAVQPMNERAAQSFVAMLARERLSVQSAYGWDVEIQQDGSRAVMRVISPDWPPAAPRALGANGENALKRDGCNHGPAHDLLVLDFERRHLSVTAGSTIRASTYRRAIGLFFFDNAKVFDLRVEVTAAPLIQRGAAALDASGVPGLGRVVLAGLNLVASDSSEAQACHTGRDLGPRLPTMQPQLAAMNIESVALAIHVPWHDRPLRAMLHPPGVLRFDARIPPADLLAYLVRQGFMASVLAEEPTRFS